MPRSIKVALGGQEYEVLALPIGKTRTWRQQLRGPFGELAEFLASANEFEIKTVADVSVLVQIINDKLLGSIDLVLDLLFAYAPGLAVDRERIEAEAYDEEAIAAFGQILGLAFPFGDLVRTLRIGETKTPT